MLARMSFSARTVGFHRPFVWQHCNRAIYLFYRLPGRYVYWLIGEHIQSIAQGRNKLGPVLPIRGSHATGAIVHLPT